MIETALEAATTIPLAVAEKAHQIENIARSLEHITNPNMRSDLTTASALATGALSGALANVEINLASIQDQAFADKVRHRLTKIRP